MEFSCISRGRSLKLKLIRDVFTDLSTTGKLTVDDEYFSFTLEDTDRKMEAGGEKIYGKTCVPRGTYAVVLNFSNRYQKVMPQVMDVPGFEGILERNRTLMQSVALTLGLTEAQLDDLFRLAATL